MDERDGKFDSVGPVLQAGGASNAVVAAIKSLNKDVTVQDRGAYMRVLVPKQCFVTREAIEKQLGHTFELPGDLELLMPSFKGLFTISEDKAVWRFEKARDQA